MEKICSSCKKNKPIEEFHNSNEENSPDGKSKICKECSNKYYQQHRQNMIDKHGEEEYRRIQWEKKLRVNAKKAGIPMDSNIDADKISQLKIKLVDYPDKGLPLSLSHVDFMKKYELNVEEYLYYRNLIKNGNFEVLNRKVYI